MREPEGHRNSRESSVPKKETNVSGAMSRCGGKSLRRRYESAADHNIIMFATQRRVSGSRDARFRSQPTPTVTSRHIDKGRDSEATSLAELVALSLPSLAEENVNFGRRRTRWSSGHATGRAEVAGSAVCKDRSL